MASRRILMGMIGRPHGVRGDVHVTSYTAEPESLAAYSPLADPTGRQFVLRWRGEGVAEVSELRDGTAVPVTDRTAAEKLGNTRLYVERSRLPPAEAEEFYLVDLVGLRAVDSDGAELGRVETVHDYGAGASLEIVREGASPLLVPFTRASVPEIDLGAGRLIVVAPEAVEATKSRKMAAE
jgi:16S rRNA processing protein RimM